MCIYRRCITQFDTNNYTVTFGKGAFHFRCTLTSRDSVANAGNNQQTGLKYKGKTRRALYVYLKNSFLWCWKLHTSEIRPEISGKFWNVVLEKNGEDHSDRTCENEEVFHRSKEEMNLPQIMKTRKANRIGHILRRNHLLKHVIWRTGRGKDRSDRKTRKKT